MKKFLFLIAGAAIGALLYQWLVHSKNQPSLGDSDNALR
jgi:hypothetical protein